MAIPLMHDSPRMLRRSAVIRSADAHSELHQAAKHLDAALVLHSKHLHGRVRTSIEDAQRCLQRAMQVKDPVPSEIANPTGATGAQTSNGQSSRSYTLAERQADLAKLLEAKP